MTKDWPWLVLHHIVKGASPNNSRRRQRVRGSKSEQKNIKNNANADLCSLSSKMATRGAREGEPTDPWGPGRVRRLHVAAEIGEGGGVSGPRLGLTCAPNASCACSSWAEDVQTRREGNAFPTAPPHVSTLVPAGQGFGRGGRPLHLHSPDVNRIQPSDETRTRRGSRHGHSRY